MTDPILYIDTSDIRPGQLETVRGLMTDLVVFAKANEPQLISYAFHVEDTGQTMTCVAIHPDSESMEFHMDIGWEKFRAFSDHIHQRSIDVYGAVSENVIARLRRKSEMLGSGKVTLHAQQAGFARFSDKLT